MSGKYIDITGKKFGRLTALERAGADPQNGDALWLCKCDCGNVVIVDGSRLRRGVTKSCGCFRREQSQTAAKHNPDFMKHMGNSSSLVDQNGVPLSSLHMSPRNKSGVIGVSFDKATGKWFARLMHKGRYVLLKSYESKSEAIEARELALAKITAI